MPNRHEVNLLQRTAAGIICEMNAIPRHLLGIGRSWAAAWVGIRHNPLAAYWMRAERHRLSTVRWWKRNLGLLILLALLSIGLTIRLVLLTLEVLAPENDPGFARMAVSTGTGLLAVGASIFAGTWLLARFYTVAQLALGFLEKQPRQQLRQTLDDMLAVSALSEQETLVGLGLHSLRLMLPPLLLLSLLRVGAQLMRTGLPASLGGALDTLGSALLVLAYAVLGGALAVLALTYLMVSVGLVPRAGMMPSVGAALQLLMQLALLGGAFYAVFLSRGMQGEEFNAMATAMYGTLMVLTVGLLLYLARRLDWVRAAVAWAFPLVLAAVGMLVYGSFAVGDDLLSWIEPITVGFTWVLQCFAIVAPLPAEALSVEVLFTYSEPTISGAWWQMGILLAMQLILLWGCAEFARDAIRRRKWGLKGE